MYVCVLLHLQQTLHLLRTSINCIVCSEVINISVIYHLEVSEKE